MTSDTDRDELSTENTSESATGVSLRRSNDPRAVGVRFRRVIRWRSEDQTRVAIWLYRGARWRVVGRWRKLKWFVRRQRPRLVGMYRRARWRVIRQVRQVRRLGWLYRGVRWRVVGRWRKLKWFIRRQRPRLVGMYRRARWLVIGRSRRLVGGARRMTTLARLPVALPSSDRDRELASRRDRRLVRAAANERFDTVTSVVAPAAPGTGPDWRRRRRQARRLFAPLPPVGDGPWQGVRVDPAQAVGGDLPELGSGRFVVIEPGLDHDVVRSLVPAVLSGRPLASGEPERVSVSGDASLTTIREFDATRMNNPQLALAAIRQVRELFGVEGRSRADAPRVSVVMSTNRPEYVPHAVAQIQAQRFVDVELLIGLHGCSGSELSDFELEGGAVSHTSIIEFAADLVFGEVLQQLSDRTTCEVLSKWDDDDLYGPHHLIDLWLLSCLTRSPLVGKAAEYVLLKDDGLLIRRGKSRTNVRSRFLAGGALLMWRDAFDAVGGWGSVPRSVDQELIERFEMSVLATTRIHGYEFVLVRHGSDHTWETSSDYFLEAADEIWSADAIGRVGLGDQTDAVRVPRPTSTVAGVDSGRCSATVCVPIKDGPESFRMWEMRAEQWSDRLSLVVCDDRSDPPLERAAVSSRVEVVRARVAPGFGAGRARHAAAQHASGEVLCFVDADMDVDPDVIEEVVGRFDRGFRGAIHAAIGFADLDLASAQAVALEHGIAAVRDRAQEHRIEGQLWRERHWAESADLTEPRSSSFRAAVGAFLALDAETYRRVGGFRDVDIRGVEDTEFGYRLLVSGCEQRVRRGPGIVHLGERTFSSDLKADEGLERERRLAAYVPIWARNLAERRELVSDPADDVVPFVRVPAPVGTADIAEALVDVHGPGTALQTPWDGAVSGAPFAFATELDPVHAADAVSAAYIAFRQRPGGEVIVAREGRVVARFVALWAMNLAATRLGLDRSGDVESDGVPDEIVRGVRRWAGSMWLAL